MISTLPLRLDLPIYAGATFKRQFRWKPDGVTGQDFTGWSGTAAIGTRNGPAVQHLTVDNGGLTLADGGLITVELGAAATDTLDAENLFYVLDLIDPVGSVVRFLRGYLKMTRDFTS